MAYDKPSNKNNQSIIEKLKFLGGDFNKPNITSHTHNHMIISINNKGTKELNEIHTYDNI